jgi:preprotein translocase subunit SecG
MQNVVLVIQLILAVSMIAIVLLQRSEGGGLGIGGGGNGGGGRPKASPLAKVTWMIAVGFLVSTISLTVMAARESGSGSVVDGLTAPEAATPELPAALDGNLLPPSAADEPALPPKVE